VNAHVIHRLQNLLRKHTPAIADSIVLEQGKTLGGWFSISNFFWGTPTELCADAQGDVHRGLQVVETAIGVTSNMLGDHIEGWYLVNVT